MEQGGSGRNEWAEEHPGEWVVNVWDHGGRIIARRSGQVSARGKTGKGAPFSMTSGSGPDASILITNPA